MKFHFLPIFSSVQNRSPETLQLADVEPVSTFDEPPNMTLIIGLSSTAGILLIIGFIVFLYIDPFGWAVFSTERFKPKYKELSEPLVSNEMKKMKTAEIESLRPYAIAYGENELEDFNVQNFLDKLRDQQKMIKKRFEAVNESLNSMNETMKNETNELKQNVTNMSTSLLQQAGTNQNTEYTVGRTHINAKLKMTPGQLSDSEDRLFGALQQFLNSMHQGRLHINDEMIEKAKKLYRKGQKDKDAVDGAESKRIEQVQLKVDANDSIELDFGDFMDDLNLESGDLEIPISLPKDKTDYTATLAQYESDLLEHENRLQSEREKQRWFLKQKMKQRQRKQGLVENDDQMNKQMSETENILNAVQVEVENEIKNEIDKQTEQLNKDFDKLFADQDLSDADRQKLTEITNDIDTEMKQQEDDLLDAFKDRQRRRKQRKVKDLAETYDNHQLQHELEQLDTQFELEEMHFEQKTHDDLLDSAFNQKQAVCADYISKNSNKNGAEVVAMLDQLEQQEDQLYARHLRNKKQARDQLRSRIKKRQKERVDELLESSPKPESASPLVDIVSDYSQYNQTVDADHLLKSSHEADQRKLKELNQEYHAEMDKIDQAEREEMEALGDQLDKENQKLEADLAEAKKDLIKGMTSESDMLLAEYAKRTNDLRAKVNILNLIKKNFCFSNKQIK